MGRPRFRRRKFFIKKEFQGKFIAAYTIGVIALAGVTTLVLNSWLHTVVDEQLYSSHMKVHRTGELFLTPLIQTNLYALLAVSLLVLIFSIVVFRRLNKHFSRMDAAFNKMAAGDYESYDPPSSRFEEINAMIDLVRKSQDDYRGLTAALSTITREIGSAVQSGCSQSEIKALHDRLTRAINQVQLPESA
jgi:methyl-accepting chemotaxis protein